MVRQRANLFLPERDVPPGGAEHEPQNVQQGGLPPPRGASQRSQAAGTKSVGKPIEEFLTPAHIGEPQIVDRQRTHAAGSPGSEPHPLVSPESGCCPGPGCSPGSGPGTPRCAGAPSLSWTSTPGWSPSTIVTPCPAPTTVTGRRPSRVTTHAWPWASLTTAVVGTPTP